MIVSTIKTSGCASSLNSSFDRCALHFWSLANLITRANYLIVFTIKSKVIDLLIGESAIKAQSSSLITRLTRTLASKPFKVFRTQKIYKTSRSDFSSVVWSTETLKIFSFMLLYRTTLPAPGHSEVNLCSVLSLGKDLSKITMPVMFNEPLSFLQRVAEYMEYAKLLKQASLETSPLARLQVPTYFNQSSWLEIFTTYNLKFYRFPDSINTTFISRTPTRKQQHWNFEGIFNQAFISKFYDSTYILFACLLFLCNF